VLTTHLASDITSDLSATQLDEVYGTTQRADAFLALFFSSSDPGYAGARLSEIDRELRRGPLLGEAHIEALGARVVAPELPAQVVEPDEGLPRPLPSSQAGFRIIDADAGTLEILTQAVGGLVDYLNAQPVTAVVNLAALWMVGKPIRIRAVRGIRRIVRGSKRLTLAIARDLIKRLDDEPPILESRDRPPSDPPTTRLVLIHRDADGLWTIVAVDIG
jgi:hypothetical protein